MEEFGATLRKLRKSKNLTLDELAENINSTSSTLSRYENGQRVPDLLLLEALANFFNVSIDYLLGRKTNALDLDSLIAQSKSNTLKSTLDIKKIIQQEISKQLNKETEEPKKDEYITVIGNAKALNISPEKLQQFIDILSDDSKKK